MTGIKAAAIEANAYKNRAIYHRNMKSSIVSFRDELVNRRKPPLKTKMALSIMTCHPGLEVRFFEQRGCF